MVHIPLLSLLVLPGALALDKFIVPRLPESDSLDFFNPVNGGGSLIDKDLTESTPGHQIGEPLNVIISAQSSPNILTDSGFLSLMEALSFGKECLDIHKGTPQQANLGDGNGWENQFIELRYSFQIPIFGTCLESLTGGNHLRMWRQNGTDAPSNALFLAVSLEEDIFKSHTISPNGYNLGRERFVNDILSLSNSSKDFELNLNGIQYDFTVSVQNLTGLVTPGTNGINHGIAIDGVIALLVITTKTLT